MKLYAQSPHIDITYPLDDSTHIGYATEFDSVAHTAITEVVTPIDTLHAVVSQTIPIKNLTIAPASNSWVIFILILSFVFFALSYRQGAKYLRHQFSSLFKVNVRGNMFDETTINENQLKLSLLTLTFVTEGIAIYYALLHDTITSEKLVLPSIIMCILLCATYYLLQLVVYRVLGNIFSNSSLSNTFIENFTSINLFIGLFFSPAILSMLFIPQVTPIALYTCLIFYILARLLIIYKGISIFLLHLFGILYLILYLCALEITPIILIKKGVVYLYKILELNILAPWK